MEYRLETESSAGLVFLAQEQSPPPTPPLASSSPPSTPSPLPPYML